MVKGHHATIQFLAVEGVLVPFLDNSKHRMEKHWMEKHWSHSRWYLISQAFIWDGSSQGEPFWHNLFIKSQPFYDE